MLISARPQYADGNTQTTGCSGTPPALSANPAYCGSLPVNGVGGCNKFTLSPFILPVVGNQEQPGGRDCCGDLVKDVLTTATIPNFRFACDYFPVTTLPPPTLPSNTCPPNVDSTVPFDFCFTW